MTIEKEKKFKSFILSSLFSSATGDVDIQKKDINGKGYPVVSSGLDNQGVIGYSDIPAKVLPANTITIDMFGNVFFRDFEYKEVTHARIFTLIPKSFELSAGTGLYIVSILSRQTKRFSYNNMASWNKMKTFEISLPVDADGSIDWQYMQERIAELEQERIAELDAYLKVTGLEDYELADEDREILRKATPDGIAIRKTVLFRASDLFDIKKGKRLTKADMIKGEINFVGSSSTDNGITARIGNTEYIHPAGCITVSYNGSVGEAFFQEAPFWASDDINIWYPKFCITPRIAEYLITVIKKHKGRYSYTAKWTIDKMKEEYLDLPVIESAVSKNIYTINDIDFDYMERYIRAIEKLSIADVVRYKDRIISETKKIAG